MSFDAEARTDFLVIGCGVAGLRAAIALAPKGRVLVLAKDALKESASEYAQGGIAVALSDEDEVGLHYDDTLRAGDEICNESAVSVLVNEGPKYIRELIHWGTKFDRKGSTLSFGREGAHSRSRVLHAHGDSTGREITRALFARARGFGDRITFHSFASTVDLIVDGGRACGVIVYDEEDKRLKNIFAGGVLLATGGLGQIYADTTNPEVATGDGVAIAFRAGAEIADMEFVQFHPTALCIKNSPRFLLSEALRGEGGILRNTDYARFMPSYSSEAELAPRDVVARAIVSEMHRTRSDFVLLDMTNLGEEFLKKRFPRIYKTCLDFNIDLASEPVPVHPAAHYAMGGVATDLEGRTTLPGLFAAGEVACTGVHGANRLASNSLLEGLVFGARAGAAMAAADASPPPAFQPQMPQLPADPAHGCQEVRRWMWHFAAIIRTGKDLCKLATKLAEHRAACAAPADVASRQAFEYRNMLLVGELIARSGVAREESRGAHYRSDHPYKLDKFKKHSRVGADMKVTFR